MTGPIYNSTDPEYWRPRAAELSHEYNRWLSGEGRYASAPVQVTKLNTMVAEQLAEAYCEGLSAAQPPAEQPDPAPNDGSTGPKPAALLDPEEQMDPYQP